MRKSGIISILLLWLLVFSPGCHIEVAENESPMAALINKLIPKSSQKTGELQEQLLSPDADLRREGVLKLGKGKTAALPASLKILGVMARQDPAPQVRATAVAVLAKVSKGPILLYVLRDAAKDRSDLVRIECIGPLAKIDSQESQSILLEILSNDENARIRGKTAAALETFNTPKVIRSLINTLADEQFAVTYQARQSLRRLTGQDFGYDQAAWRKWMNQQEPSETTKITTDN